MHIQRPSAEPPDPAVERDIVIRVDGLTKKFCRSLKHILLYGTWDILREMLGLRHDGGRLRPNEFLALDNVNLEIRRGETLGLVGANGCGKTTLLRLINGIFPPDAGRITVKGRVGALIAVGAGFHPHMTGRENIYLNGTILGMTRKQIDTNLDSIIAFADIGEFIDAPVSTYSSGMHVRLGFAIAIHSEPDIMLVDEILAVGDARFQRKCLDRIREMRKRGVSFILVTHNMHTVDAMCDRAVLLDRGRVVAIGPPGDVVAQYEIAAHRGNSGRARSISPNGTLPQLMKYCDSQNDFGKGDEIEITSVTVLAGSDAIATLNSGEPMSVAISLESNSDLKNIYLWVSFAYVADHEEIEESIAALASRNVISLPKGKATIVVAYPTNQLTTGIYKIGVFFLDDLFVSPLYRGYFGYFSVSKNIPTLLKAGTSTPLCWTDPEITITPQYPSPR